jgi:L-seryl-tRNA(Ser) seleniumtransferase
MDKVLDWPEVAALAASTSRTELRAAVRTVLEQVRRQIGADKHPDLTPQHIAEQIARQLQQAHQPSLRRLINGSGIVIHTNLGRSPLPKAAEAALLETAWGYSNLELDLQTGERGERYQHVEQLLCELTGAEAALVVNNNAAAVLLALSGLAHGREVIVSRGELVEIGGSFRIPDVMRQSGATLVEVGTTNRTHPKDYRSAITEQTALLLKVHTSNFAVVGFTAEVDTAAMVQIGQQAGLPTVVDAGSGSLIDLARFGIPGEATVQEHLAAGAALVTFSGDKLLGGPQAGLLVGKREIIDALKRHQLLRALRIDKLTLASLESVLRLYRDERWARTEIPTLQMLTASLEELDNRLRRMLRRLRRMLPSAISLKAASGSSSPGGGSFPLLQLPTRLIEVTLPGLSANGLELALRTTTPPVVGRIQRDHFMLDVRTLRDEELPLLAAALLQALER